MHGWEELYWSHPLLQNRAYHVNQKGVFEQCIKDRKLICPEPYHSNGYYNQTKSMAEAFDEYINNTNDHSDLSSPKLFLSSREKQSIQKVIREELHKQKKSKSLVIQPYGSGLNLVGDKPKDLTHRSLDVDDYLTIVEKLNQDFVIFSFIDQRFRHPGDKFSVDLSKFSPDLRMYMSLISETDYFVGCDSVGQHIARGFDKKGLVIMGSTFEKNVSYPDYFKFYRKKNQKPIYNPIRISGQDGDFVDRLNDGIMDFTSSDLDSICRIVKNDTLKDSK